MAKIEAQGPWRLGQRVRINGKKTGTITGWMYQGTDELRRCIGARVRWDGRMTSESVPFRWLEPA